VFLLRSREVPNLSPPIRTFAMFKTAKTADTIISAFTSVVAKLEAHADEQQKKITTLRAEQNRLEEQRLYAEMEATKAATYANKVKAIFA
jgi:hypothetical protein